MQFTLVSLFFLQTSPAANIDQNVYMTPEAEEDLLYLQIKSLNVPHIDRHSIE